MRQHPIGTGPFKFVEFKPNESIRLAKNPDYWKPGLPYLDGIEYTVSRNRSTVILAFIAGQYDLTFAGSVSVPLMHDTRTRRRMPPASSPAAASAPTSSSISPSRLSTTPSCGGRWRWRSTANPLSTS
jgi:ABC-type transport system substrate-binding protein